MRRQAREGFILISVLGVMALLAALVGALSMMVRPAVERARAGGEDLALTALVRAGVELAGYQLYGLKLPANQIDAQQVRLDAGVLALSVTDESGKIDLNGSDPAFLAGAYRAAGLSALPPSSFAARVIDWRDEDDERSAGGAEAPDYTAAGLNHRPQNDAFRSVDELGWLQGLLPAHVAALAPLVTVHNPDGKLNVLSASREALLAVPGVSATLVDRVMALRQKPDNAGATEILSLLQAQQAFVKVEPGPSYRVRIEARHAGSRVKTVEAVLAPSQSSDALYYVVGWTE